MVEDEYTKLLRNATARIDEEYAPLIRNSLMGSRLTQADLENAFESANEGGEKTFCENLKCLSAFLKFRSALYKKGNKLLGVCKKDRHDWKKRVFRAHVNKRILPSFESDPSEQGVKQFINFCVFMHMNADSQKTFTKDKLYRHQVKRAAKRALSSTVSIKLKIWLLKFIQLSHALPRKIFSSSPTLTKFCKKYLSSRALEANGITANMPSATDTDFWMNLLSSKQLDDYTVNYCAEYLNTNPIENPQKIFNDSRIFEVLHRLGSVKNSQRELFRMILNAMNVDYLMRARGSNILDKWIDSGLVEIIALIESNCTSQYPRIVQAISTHPFGQKRVMSLVSRGAKMEAFSYFIGMVKAAEQAAFYKLRSPSRLYFTLDEVESF